MTTPPQSEEGLREALINHPKAMISTDDNYPIIIKIPLEELLQLFQSTMLSCLPEPTILTPWKNAKDMPEHQKQLGRNQAIAEWRANILKACGADNG